MTMESKNTKYNLLFGILSQAVSIILGVILPRLFLANYGSEINGLLSSVTQIYAYIALVEAGIGTASLQALYRTVGKQDRYGTNSILAAINNYYKRTGVIYLFCIFAFATVYPFLIHSDIPHTTIIFVIVFNGLGSVVNFFFQGKYKLLLQAEGKNYIITNLNTVIHVATNVAKIFFVASGFDIVVVQLSAFAVNLLQMVYIDWYIKKQYAWIDLTATPDYASIAQSKNVLIHQMSGLVFNNTDTIILTFVCGLKMVSVYSMYTLLFGMVSTFLNTVTDSVSFVFGQTYHTNRKQYVRILEMYELYYMSLVAALYTVANFFILPFLSLYTRGITDIEYVNAYLPYFFVSTYLLSCGRKTSNLTINFAEHFKLTQNRSILEAVINILVSLICVFRFGIYGVLLGTIAALLYRTNDMIIYANKKILHRSPWKTYRRWLVNLALFIVVTVLSKPLFARIALDTYPRIILWAAITSIVVIPLFFVVASMFDRETYRYAKTLVTPYLKQVRGKLKRRSRTKD